MSSAASTRGRLATSAMQATRRRPSLCEPWSSKTDGPIFRQAVVSLRTPILLLNITKVSTRLKHCYAPLMRLRTWRTNAGKRQHMLLLIDNYDSFTYNLYQYLAELGAEIEVRRNDRVTLAEIENMQPEQIVISPGPCTPNEAGLSCQIIATFGLYIPILGVCLGHQAIGQVYGGRVVRAPEPMHRKTSLMYHNGQRVFAGLPQPFAANRYHSLIVERATLPA